MLFASTQVSNMELHPTDCEVSMSQEQKLLIVSVRCANKRYGTGKDAVVALKSFTMGVQKGTIFSLLGASGCGKTTLLSCILGRRRLDSGEITVFGEAVGTGRTSITSRVGYMPQEMALYGDFTIGETLLYFGWVAGMNSESIEEKSAALSKLLMLPPFDQMVNSLSGGEQRRVSFASALLPGAELLILDEPTVGVDPLLREMIWDYLLKITREEGVTVIVTTHYIEEARKADTIGLMRGGELLAQNAPDILLQKFAVQSLEEVFLQLSTMQNKGYQQSDAAKESCFPPNTNNIRTSTDKKRDFKISDCMPDLNRNHLKALVWKNILWWMRNIPALVLMVALPGLTVALFCMSVRNPKDLPIAVVDYQTNNSDVCSGTLTCNGTQLSCNYLQYLKKHSLRVVYYNSEAEAVKSVLQGQVYASVVLKHNYSKALKTRITKGNRATPWDIESSNIDVVRDLTNTQIASFLKWYFYDAFSNFMEDYLPSCDMDPKLLSSPIHWGSPVYGLHRPSFVDFSMPGILLTAIFSLGVLLTSFTLLIERNEGNLERTFVIGITELELILAHLICGVLIMVVQVALSLTFGFAVFDVTQNGALVLVIVYALLAAFCGMCYGIFIACICESDSAISALATGSFFPVIVLGGIIWPIEGMHYLLKPVGLCLPLTRAVEGLRSVLQKNWGLSSEVVWLGYGVMVMWIIIFFVVSLLFLKLRNR